MKGISIMKAVTFRFLAGWVAFFVACGSAVTASAQTRTIRIVSYNIEDDVGVTTPLPGLIAPSSGGSVTNGGVLEGIGEEILGSDPAQPIDILGLEETTSSSATVQPILNGLNVFYSFRGISAGYAQSTLVLTTTGGSGGGPSALVYNTNTVQLLASVGVGTPSGSGEARQIGRYLFAPAGVATNSSNIFYVYVSHAKSGTDAGSAMRRGVEAGIIRGDSATLPSNARILYTGDLNDSTSAEVMYQTMIAVGVNQAFDILNLSRSATNDWGSSTSNTGILAALTESDTDLRFRDDYQMMTSNVLFGVAGGLAYVPGTYHTFANNGTTPYNGSVNNTNVTGGNTSLSSDLNTNGIGLSKSQIYQDLTTASDHLPEVADYTIPFPSSVPVASFTGSPTSGNAPLAVTFTDTSTGSITNWNWNFGDGGTTNITTNTVLYTYNTAGVYTVTEIISGSGGSSTNTKVAYITAVTPPPVTNFTGSPTNGVAPLAVTFTDTSTGSITNWSWNFGDGGTTNLTTNSVLYTYNTAGVYTVTEIVNGSGGSSTNTKVAYITAVTAPPVANFTGSPTSGTEPLVVTFTDSSTGSITNRFWDFGNGNTTNFTVSTSPSQTYTAGTYTVSLTVSGPGGNNTDIQTSYITVLSVFQAWQIQYFGSTNNPSAAPGADPDGDGQSNLAEFLAGTNPTNSASGLRIISVTVQGSDVLVIWTTAGGETNVVQSTAGLPDGSYSTNFLDLSPLIIISGSGDAITNYLDQGGATNVPSRYYRIRLQP
jgi:PKD repeat protein